MRRILKSQQGFTLIELVIIIILIAVLAGVAIPRYVDLRGEAEDAKAQAVQDAGQAGMTLDFANDILTTGTYASGLTCGSPPCDVVGGDPNFNAINANMEQPVNYPPNGSYGNCTTGFCWRIADVGSTSSPARIYGMYDGVVVDNL